LLRALEEDAQRRLVPVSKSNALQMPCSPVSGTAAGEPPARLLRGRNPPSTEESLPERTAGGFPLARQLLLCDMENEVNIAVEACPRCTPCISQTSVRPYAQGTRGGAEQDASK